MIRSPVAPFTLPGFPFLSAAAGTALFFAAALADTPARAQDSDSGDGVAAGTRPGRSDMPPLVQEKCSGCHRTPRPGTMPRWAWPKLIDLMVKFMADAEVPFTAGQKRSVTNYYLANSPEKLPDIPDDYEPGGLAFAKHSIGLPSRNIRPMISSVRFVDLDGDGKENEVLVSDNASGEVSWLRQESGIWTETKLATISSPADALPVDIDGDGDLDLAVSAMGTMYPPNDKLIGEFHLLYNEGDGTFTPRKIVQGTPRIVSATPADYDGDGDLDFVLAMFGWRETGGISFLENLGNGNFSLHPEPVMEINGAMQVFRNDADGDGRPDFIALITQQHEAIVQFRNGGDGSFRHEIIHRADTPSYGLSSMDLADLDGDGDEDILFTSGDMMDETPVAKPTHGLHWLEKLGDGQYRYHRLARMPGCYCAKAIDMNGNGNLDIVFSSLHFQWKEHDFPSLAWLENVSGDMGTTVPRKIAYSPSNLARIEAGDINGDGTPDIVAGGMFVPGPLDRAGRITLWLGRGRAPESR